MRAILASLLLLATAATAQAGDTLETIRERGVLRCGARAIFGYAMPDEAGKWRGFNIDFCRAVAAVVLGNADRFEVVPTEPRTRFKALTEGGIDLLVDGATVTLGRETKMGVDFPVVWLYDGQAFLAHRALGLKSIRDAHGATICAIDGSTSHINLQDYLKRTHLDAHILTTNTTEGALTAYLRGRCDILTGDRTDLLAHSTFHTGNPDDNQILPEVISKEPLGPAIRSGDDRWRKVVRWTFIALVTAEERGVTAQTVGQLSADGDTELAILTGHGPDYAEDLGVAPGWARRAIEQVGNYGEIFDKHLGSGSLLRSERGTNALWTRGGLLYAPPLQ